MHLNLLVSLFVFMLGVIFVTAQSTENNVEYLGSRPSKKYFFPWIVTFHRVRKLTKEFFGTGSILTNKYVLGSMDCFIRKSKGALNEQPFYVHLDQVDVVAGGIWAERYSKDEALPPWVELRKIKELLMFSDPDVKHSFSLSITSTHIPSELNSLKRSPFGFSMALVLVTLKEFKNGEKATFEYKRHILPIPVHFGNSKSDGVRNTLFPEFAVLEIEPFRWRCHVGGWRAGDRRLLDYEVVYVPIKQCQSIYCSYDTRACVEWPVPGVHVCFKSLTFTDLCWRDQGSALYCEQLSDSVVAILTSAPTCGHGGLPGVYTLIDNGLLFLERYETPDQTYEPIPKSELLSKYAPPKNEKDLIPTDDY